MTKIISEIINLDDFRNQIGVVPQEVFLFSDTIANNIKFGMGTDDVEHEQIENAAKMMHVHHNIIRFKEKYETLLKYAKDANMNFVRVWGGGIYENEIFYELCDELGLLIWQDFMFACASYPEHKEFMKNVEDEVEQNIERLQHHPSIALWCGNNENEWIWHQEMKTSYKEMPGYKIYHEVIPDILKAADPERPYWPSSPFGSDDDPNAYSSGNRHEWGIWSKWIDYSEVKNDNSLFVTEFGFQGPANKKTFEKYLSKNKRYSQDPVFEFHNKQVEGPERVFKFLSGNLPIKTEWEDFIYLAQLNQALALKTCLERWRINWPVANGSIIWQLNDCWPVARKATKKPDTKINAGMLKLDNWRRASMT